MSGALVVHAEPMMAAHRVIWKNTVESFGAYADTDLDRACRSAPECRVVWCRPEAAVHREDDLAFWLSDYSHPANAIYVFGPDTGPVQDPEPTDHILMIETGIERAALWSFVAAGIVLHDRRVKLG